MSIYRTVGEDRQYGWGPYTEYENHVVVINERQALAEIICFFLLSELAQNCSCIYTVMPNGGIINSRKL